MPHLPDEGVPRVSNTGAYGYIGYGEVVRLSMLAGRYGSASFGSSKLVMSKFRFGSRAELGVRTLTVRSGHDYYNLGLRRSFAAFSERRPATLFSPCCL